MKTTNNNNLKSLDQLIEEQYGTRGAEAREAFEKGYEDFRLGVLLKQARIEKGMTQEELAKKIGTNKSHISRVENNIKDVRISTLKRIIEKGLDGHLEMNIII